MSGSRAHAQRSLSSSTSRSSPTGYSCRDGPPEPHINYQDDPSISFVPSTSTTSRIGSMSRTSSSDQGRYASPTSYQMTSETQNPQSISCIEAPWPGPGFPHPAQWSHSGHFADSNDHDSSGVLLASWDHPSTDPSWNVHQPQPGTYQPSLAGPPMPLISRQSGLVGYRSLRPPAASQTIAYAGWDTEEMPYPVIYTNVRVPSPEEQRRISPIESNVADTEALERVARRSQPPSEYTELASASEIQQAWKASRPKKGTKSAVSRQTAKPSSALTKIAKSQKQSRTGPLSEAQRQKADDMRYFGACWRCRKYKKPVSIVGQPLFHKTKQFKVQWAGHLRYLCDFWLPSLALCPWLSSRGFGQFCLRRHTE